jgi:hypothetical protein
LIPAPGVNLTPRPDLSTPEELVVEISLDVEPFRAAMEATAAAARALGESIRNRDPAVLEALAAAGRRARQTMPPDTGEFRRSLYELTPPVDDQVDAARYAFERLDTNLARAASIGTATASELRAALDAAGLPVTGELACTVAELTRCGVSAERAASTLAGILNAYGGGLPAGGIGVWMQDRRLAPPTYATTIAPEQVDDGQAHDFDPGRCWKCDAKPGVEELDGACWRCWYRLTGSTKAPPRSPASP